MLDAIPEIDSASRNDSPRSDTRADAPFHAVVIEHVAPWFYSPWEVARATLRRSAQPAPVTVMPSLSPNPEHGYRKPLSISACSGAIAQVQLKYNSGAGDPRDSSITVVEWPLSAGCPRASCGNGLSD